MEGKGPLEASNTEQIVSGLQTRIPGASSQTVSGTYSPHSPSVGVVDLKEVYPFGCDNLKSYINKFNNLTGNVSYEGHFKGTKKDNINGIRIYQR